jgi:histidinol-phosphate aminotransferase
LVDAAGRVGGVVVPVPLNDNLENDLPALAARVNARTKAVFLVNPHNPSGTVSPAAEFTAFAEAVSKRALVVVDEAYLEFCDDFRGRTAANLTRAGANVIVFRTFSKAHGLAALAFGYAVAPRPLADFLRSRGVGFARDLNRLSIAAASGSLSDPAQIDRVRLLVTDERNAWHNDLNALGLRHTAAAGNFVYFDAGRPADEVAAAFAREGIVIGRVFPPYNTWVRISIGLPEENARARAVLPHMTNGSTRAKLSTIGKHNSTYRCVSRNQRWRALLRQRRTVPGGDRAPVSNRIVARRDEIHRN